jgi:murein DD-endopeptidase MepM/ murein hydrolase activator NlpD
MKLISALFLSALVFMMFPVQARSLTDSNITLSSGEMARGDVILLSIKSDEKEMPKATWMGREIFFVFNRARNVWQGFLAADLDQKPGAYEAIVSINPSDPARHVDIRITDKDYGVRRLTLPKDKVELDAEALKRVKAESEIVGALWKAKESIPEWKGIFLMPLDGDVEGIFGKRSDINGLERSPHTGVDLRGSLGEPVKAVNNGKVALIADHFFTGNSVFLDHGGGIFTMYFHLSKVMVKEGDIIKKGQVIGLVGATGRATGPHLHWGMRVNGARVNPLTLTVLSKGLEE